MFNSQGQKKEWTLNQSELFFFFFHFTVIKALQGIWFSIQNANGNSSLNSNYLKITSCSASVTHIPPVYLPYCQSSLWQSEWLQEEDPTPPHTKQNCLQATQIFSAPGWLMIMLMEKNW